MTITEKIQCSADKAQSTLYKEGLFYKCYNENAMVYSQCVRAYKISIKFVKNVGVKVMSLGFPVSALEKGNLSLEHISEKIRAKKIEVSDDDVVLFWTKPELKAIIIYDAQKICFITLGG